MAKKMTTKSAVTIKPEISSNGLITVYGTEKSEQLKTGESYEVSVKLAETLVKNGHAMLKNIKEIITK